MIHNMKPKKPAWDAICSRIPYVAATTRSVELRSGRRSTALRNVERALAGLRPIVSPERNLRPRLAELAV